MAKIEISGGEWIDVDSGYSFFPLFIKSSEIKWIDFFRWFNPTKYMYGIIWHVKLPMFQTHSAYAQRHELKGLMYLGHRTPSSRLQPASEHSLRSWCYLYLVGGWPTPLKNHGVRQLGWWNSQYDGKVENVPNHQSELYLLWWIKKNNEPIRNI